MTIDETSGDRARLSDEGEQAPALGVARAPAVVANPAALDDPAGARAAVEAALTSAGTPPPQWYETTPEDPGTEQVHAAVAAGADLVLAMGGDGTVRACAAALAGTSVPLGLLPAGTGNLLAHNLYLPSDLDRAVAVAVGGSELAMDLAELDGVPYAVMGGSGFDAEIFGRTSDALKDSVGRGAYVWAALSTARRSRSERLVLDVDGASHEMAAAGVVIANVGRVTGGIPLLPGARPDDGQLDVAVLTASGLAAWAGLGARLALRRPPRPHQLVAFTGAKVRLEWERSRPVEVDGDLLDERRAMTFQVLPAAVTVRVSRDR